MAVHRKSINGFVVSTWLVASLWLGRVYFSHSLYYGFLLWNLLLAYIPFGVSSLLTAYQQQHRFHKYGRLFQTLIWWGLFTSWLLFFPNAPYIITDIIHLSPRHNVPLWYDAALLFVAALNGLWVGCLSLLQMEAIWRQRFPKINANLFVLSVLLLCGFGIYLGRMLRFNSWDVVQNPAGITTAVLQRLLMPWQHLRTWGITLIFAAILWVGYTQVKNLRQHLVS